MANPSLVIIDSGIDDLTLGGSLVKEYEYDKGLGKWNEVSQSFDHSGHGTACASIIKKKIPSVSIISLRILNKESKTSITALNSALKFCLELDSALIHLSLATTSIERVPDLKATCELLKKEGKIIVCSESNTSRFSYPASFSSVIGVRGSFFENEEELWFNPNYTIQAVASLVPEYTTRSANQYMFMGGNSKAAALVTSEIIRYMREGDLKFERILQRLESQASRREWSEGVIIRSFNSLLSKSPKCIELSPSEKGIYQALLQWLPEGQIKIDTNLFLGGFLQSPDRLMELLQKIEQHFELVIPDDDLQIQKFITPYSIIKLITGCL
ncbi:hypothetical protein PAECIP112173_03218 [Paenibacillus sp. JJ-100]|nr:hypothetical protein PAECIP112173_03218 [Paenibacillus sp. JJ-100]